MASTTFGEHLRRERELRGVSLDEVSAATRIKPGFLEALENGRWEELPGGAFNRGFIRATSRFLGLDEDGMVAEYALETGTATPAKRASDSTGAMPRDYRPAIVALCALLFLIIAGVWLGHHEYWVHKHKRMVATQAVADSSSSAAYTSPGGSTRDAISGAAVSAPATPNSGGSELAAANASSSPIAGSPGTADTLKLKIEATKKAELKVVGDGKTLFKGRIRSAGPKVFEAKDTFEVTAGDPDRVHVELNGQTVPFAATTGRQGKVSLSRKDLKASGQAAE